MAKNNSWLELIIMPLVIACVGVIGTYFITMQQEKNARTQADSDRQIQILQIFANKITSNDEKQRLLAIKLLRVMDDELAEKLAIAVAEEEPENSKIKEVATLIAGIAKARIELKPIIYLHIQNEKDAATANRIGEVLKTNNWKVSEIDRVNAEFPKFDQLRYFRKSEKPKAEEIQAVLKNANYNISIQYVHGYEKSKMLKPLHFEIWFGSEKS